MARLLEVEDLSTSFPTFAGVAKAVDGVSFHVDDGETLALVGESGCGKSVTARSVMGLYSGTKAVQRGVVRFAGEDLSAASEARRRELRGPGMGMVFQEPMAAFDPLSTIADQMIEARLAHVRSSRRLARAEAVEALRSVGIADPELRVDEYPHRLSGGMLQRVLVAIALMNRPRLLIADEPTTALDVTIQAQVLRLLAGLRRDTGSALLFITHDLGVVAEIADRVHVMYGGRIVEKGSVADVFAGPLHPYARGLLDSRVRRELKGGTLPSIPGSVPSPTEAVIGCRFAARCPEAGPRCLASAPPLAPVGAGSVPGSSRAREAACWLYQGGVS